MIRLLSAISLCTAISGEQTAPCPVGGGLCGGQLAAVVKNASSADKCSFVGIGMYNGVFTAPLGEFKGCLDDSGASSSVPQTAISYDSREFFFASGRGRNVFAQNYMSGASRVMSNSLPASYDWLVGLQYLTHPTDWALYTGLYAVTTEALLFSQNASTNLAQVASLSGAWSTVDPFLLLCKLY